MVFDSSVNNAEVGKKVTRLNLVFEKEDPLQFVRRVERARYFKFKAEKVLLIDYFIRQEMPEYFNVVEMCLSTSSTRCPLDAGADPPTK